MTEQHKIVADENGQICTRPVVEKGLCRECITWLMTDPGLGKLHAFDEKGSRVLLTRKGEV